MPSPASIVTNQKGARTKAGCAIIFVVWIFAIGVFVWCATGSPDGKDRHETLGTIALIVAVFGAPIPAILFIFDLLSYLNWKQKGGVRLMLWRGLIGLSCWLTAFVVLAIVFGATAAGIDSDWSNPDLKKILVTLLWIGLALMFVRIAWELLKMPFNRKASSTEAAEDKAYEERQHFLANPDFTGLEAALSSSLPASYKALFVPGSEWLAEEWTLYPKGVDNDDELYPVLGLEPARAEAVRHHKARPETLVCFAMSEFGEYLISSGSDDPPVFHVDISGQFPGEAFCEISPRLSEFLVWSKEKI